VSIVNSHRLKLGRSTVGFINPTMYKNSTDFANDVTTGNNRCAASANIFSDDSVPGTCCETGFYSAEGWDPATGFGSIQFPKFYDLFLNLGYTYTPFPTSAPTKVPTPKPTRPTATPTAKPTVIPTTFHPMARPTVAPSSSSGGGGGSDSTVSKQTADYIVIGVLVGVFGLGGLGLLVCYFKARNTEREDMAAAAAAARAADRQRGGTNARAMREQRVESPSPVPFHAWAEAFPVATATAVEQPNAVVRGHLMNNLAESITDRIQREIEMNAMGASGAAVVTSPNQKGGSRSKDASKPSDGGRRYQQVPKDSRGPPSRSSGAGGAAGGRTGSGTGGSPSRTQTGTVAGMYAPQPQRHQNEEEDLNSAFAGSSNVGSNVVVDPNSESIDLDESEVGKLNLAYSFIPPQPPEGDDDNRTVDSRSTAARKNKPRKKDNDGRDDDAQTRG
jgi:hypothetical protein